MFRPDTNARVAHGLYERIGAFLVDQKLEPTPANYAFAWHLLRDPNGPLARAVEELTMSGVRLTERHISGLAPDAPPREAGVGVTSQSAQALQVAQADKMQEQVDGLVAKTQQQVDGFAEMVQTIRDETADFGRDLAASADAIRRSGGDSLDKAYDSAMFEEVTRITANMLERVHRAESQLESATQEASELRSALEEARDNARRDPLTLLPNRRAFEEMFRAKQEDGARLCVALCDVDFFKSVNDRFGHAVGDRVLRSIAQTLSETCKGHLIARYGGEEFAILFSGVGISKAEDILEHARATVASKRYRLRETDAPLGEITFSAGITRVHAGEDLEESLHRADLKLYEAKEAGRNRVCGC